MASIKEGVKKTFAKFLRQNFFFSTLVNFFHSVPLRRISFCINSQLFFLFQVYILLVEISGIFKIFKREINQKARLRTSSSIYLTTFYTKQISAFLTKHQQNIRRFPCPSGLNLCGFSQFSFYFKNCSITSQSIYLSILSLIHI